METEVEVGVTLREMVVEDLVHTVEMSLEQVWPHRIEDWRLLLSLGRGVVCESGGKIVGCAMGWEIGMTHAAIGMVIVRKGNQGRGIGRQMMEYLIDLFAGRSLMLNATEHGLPLYASLGFKPTGRIIQHQGLAPTMPLPELRSGERVRPMGAADTSLVDEYSAATGLDRRVIFEAMAAKGKVIVLERDMEPAGFAIMGHFGRGRAIAPIVAPDLDGATIMINHFLSTRAGQFCRIDVVDGTGLSEWLEEIGLPAVGSVVSMVRGTAPVADSTFTSFAIATQAFG